jgi:hypothetical protein
MHGLGNLTVRDATGAMVKKSLTPRDAFGKIAPFMPR